MNLLHAIDAMSPRLVGQLIVACIVWTHLVAQAQSPSPGISNAAGGMSRYVNPAEVASGATAIAYRGDEEVARRLISAVPQPVTLLQAESAFFADGLFDRTLVGDVRPLKTLGFGLLFRRVLVLQISESRCAVQGDLEGITLCQMNVEVIEVDPGSAAIVRRGRLTIQGKGFSMSSAYSRVLDDGDVKARLFFATVRQ